MKWSIRRETGSALASAVSAILFVAAVPAMAAGKPLADMSCEELWISRNAIYARFGMCFKTERSLKAFGRVCRAPFGQLDEKAQSEADGIAAIEK